MVWNDRIKNFWYTNIHLCLKFFVNFKDVLQLTFLYGIFSKNFDENFFGLNLSNKLCKIYATVYTEKW